MWKELVFAEILMCGKSDLEKVRMKVPLEKHRRGNLYVSWPQSRAQIRLSRYSVQGSKLTNNQANGMSGNNNSFHVFVRRVSSISRNVILWGQLLCCFVWWSRTSCRSRYPLFCGLSQEGDHSRISRSY